MRQAAARAFKYIKSLHFHCSTCTVIQLLQWRCLKKHCYTLQLHVNTFSLCVTSAPSGSFTAAPISSLCCYLTSIECRPQMML